MDSGAYSTVHKGQFFYDDVAIKVLNLENMETKTIINVVKEIILLARVRHPNILNVFAVSFAKQEIYIITEYFENKSLQIFMNLNRNKLKKINKIKILFDVAKAINYLHSLPKPIIHCDIKPHNVLIDKHLRAKIGDFG